jgi:CheY-like chemotaxis protein/two-component sensor histidine kinase
VKDPAELARAIETIQRNARVQAQLIDDLLDMSRITSGKLRIDVQPVQAASVIDAAIETLRPAADAKGIAVETRLNPSAGAIAGDPARLQQVIWNVLSNAIKFTPAGGAVHVTLQRVDACVEIRVSDTGAGIKAEFLPHLFERFRQADPSTTRRHGGLGLGLSIVKHLVELHGGTIALESAGEGRGTTVTIQLPSMLVQRSTHTTAADFVAPALPAGLIDTDLSGVTVLVVDDQVDSRDLMKRVLEECRARVFSAASAEEALALVETERPDVMVSDIGMPDVDGFELLRRVRALGAERGGRTPAIAVTAFARSEDRTRTLRAGFLVHVSKPFEPSELVATVASVAGRIDE